MATLRRKFIHTSLINLLSRKLDLGAGFPQAVGYSSKLSEALFYLKVSFLPWMLSSFKEAPYKRHYDTKLQRLLRIQIYEQRAQFLLKELRNHEFG